MSNTDCFIPTYIMNDFQKETCGHTLGKVSALVIFFILLIFFSFIYLPRIFKKKKDEDDKENKKKDKVKISTLVIIFICILIVSIAVYFIRIFFFKVEISQDESMIQNFMNNYKMTETEAIKEIAKVRQMDAFRNRHRRGTTFYYN